MFCITMLSDFGTSDVSVAIAKGIILQHVPYVSIIDLSHDIPPYQLKSAAYLLATGYENFPAGTVHICLTDIFYQSNPRLLLCEYNQHFFLLPDNGCCTLALGTTPEKVWLCYEMAKSENFTDWMHQIGSTLNLIDSNSEWRSKMTATLMSNKEISSPIVINDKEIVCEAIYSDRYENVVLNVTKQQFISLCNNRRFSIKFRTTEEITKICSNYNEVKEGDKLCRFNSNGFLEICINRGKALSLFGLRIGGKNNNIKIIFQ